VARNYRIICRCLAAHYMRGVKRYDALDHSDRNVTIGGLAPTIRGARLNAVEALHRRALGSKRRVALAVDFLLVRGVRKMRCFASLSNIRGWAGVLLSGALYMAAPLPCPAPPILAAEHVKVGSPGENETNQAPPHRDYELQTVKRAIRCQCPAYPEGRAPRKVASHHRGDGSRFGGGCAVSLG
jgi:hypothetical protein